MYELNYQDPYEQQKAVLQGLGETYAPNTDFGRVSMGQAPEQPAPEQVQQQADTASIMDASNIEAAQGVGEAVRDARTYAYTTQGATDSEALGEGMFAFGLAMLANASQPGADFGASLAAGLGQGSKAFTGALNRNKRYENREALEAKGFTQESIDAYIASGDNKQLVKGEVKNYMKTKEMNGQLYQYDERDPAGTMQLAQSGPRQIKSSVDLGDRVEVHYTDGTSEVKSKGMTAAQKAKAYNDGKKAEQGASKPKWEPTMVEWQDPETKQFKTISVYADVNNPGVYSDMNGNAIRLPEGAKPTSEAQWNTRNDKRYKAQDEAALVANNIANTTAAVADILGTDVGFYDVSRFLPYTESADNAEKAKQSRSTMMVSQYSSMPGVAGASVQTEKEIINSMPPVTASSEVKAVWAKKKLSYDEKVLSATIRQHEERYGYVDPSLTSALDAVKQQKEQLNTSLDEYRANKSSAPQGIVRAPSSNVYGGGSAYGGAAQAKASNTATQDFSGLW